MMREALREYLRRVDVREREEADRRGYERSPDEPGPWEALAEWADE